MSEPPIVKFKLSIQVSEVGGPSFEEFEEFELEYPTNPLVQSSVGYRLLNLAKKVTDRVTRALPGADSGN